MDDMDGREARLVLMLQNTRQIMYERKKKYMPAERPANIINVNCNSVKDSFS